MVENGAYDLNNDGNGPTMIQVNAFFMAKSHWREKEREEAKERHSSSSNSLSRRDKARRVIASSRQHD